MQLHKTKNKKKEVFSPSIEPVEMLSLLSDRFNMERLIG